MGFPIQILRVCINMYCEGRHIHMYNMVKGPYYATRGITAGCAFATTFTRVYTIEPLDTLRLPPATQLALYIDDSGTSSVGQEKVVVEGIVEATTQIHEALVTDLGCHISDAKAAVVSTSKPVVAALSRRLDDPAGTQQTHGSAVDLGVDFYCGKTIRQLSRHN